MRIVYLCLGSISLALGTIGIILPVLPTVPFMLLTTYFFSKSSNKFHQWFISTKIYHLYIEDFINNRSMTKQRKWTLLIFVDIMLFLSFILVNSMLIKGLIILIFVYKHYYFYKYVEIKKP
ncbi:MAG: YbaN family protein [Candidatus Izemoplasmatales bacterium]